MSRYDIPDPICEHYADLRNLVDAGDPYGRYAGVWVCVRPECLQDAVEWVTAKTHMPVFVNSEPA